MRAVRVLAAFIAGMLCAAGVAWPQAYPAKPVRVIVPFPPGGANDIVARIVLAKLSEQMGQSFIIDHLGLMQPRTPPAPREPWAELPKVLDLAKRKNAVIKVSGACTLSQKPYPFPDIWDPLRRIFDAWGIERCLWGTDWTRAYAVVNYEQAVKPFVETKRLSANERAMLMGGACAKAYGWSPKKGRG